MTEPTYSFVYDKKSAIQTLRQSDPQRLMLAVLAGITPQDSWEGCLIYLGASPLEAEGSAAALAPATICVGTQGPGADEVQQHLVEALERFGVEVLQVYEGGPEVELPLARMKDGRWAEP